MGGNKQIAFILLVAGILIFVNEIPEALPLLKTPIEAGTVDYAELRQGDRVLLDVAAVYDCLVTETTTEVKDGEIGEDQESARYYAVPSIRSNEVEDMIDHLMVVKVDPKQFTAFERANDRFNTWWNDISGKISRPEETLATVDGLLEPMSDIERTYVQNYFEDQKIDGYVIPYVLHPLDKKSILGFTGIGFLTGVIGFIWCVRVFWLKKI